MGPVGCIMLAMSGDYGKVRESYDAAAASYAEHLFNELERKLIDRHLLNRFAEEIGAAGLVADLGCGPGHVAKHLHELGLDVVGIDLSPGMVRVASERNPGISFSVGDMTRLEFGDASLAGAVAFYSIVHLRSTEVAPVAREIARVLRPDGLAFVAFHAGDEVVHVDELYGAPVSLDFRFHDPDAVIDVLQTAGLHVIEKVVRDPYEGVEYPTRRCYLIARRIRSAGSV